LSTIHSPFSSWHITTTFSAILIFFCRLFTCIALGDDLCFSFSYQKPMLIKWELHELRLFQIVLNRTLSCEFEKWYKFLSQITAKSHKKKCKKRTALQMGGGGTAETHFLNTALQGGSWSAPCTSHFTSRQNLLPTV